MLSLIKNTVMMIILVALAMSCNQNMSLQTYFVDHQEQPDFVSLDIPTSILDIDETTLTEDQKQAYESINKLNMLAYRFDEGKSETEDYKKELSQVQTLLKDKKYSELMRGGNSTDGKFVFKYLEKNGSIDEFILFGNANDKGFAIVRILGSNMNAKKIMDLASAMENADFSDSQISQFTDFFK
ncbi:MAG: hypothetical protein BM564_09560 [Bacteroidetes bacterium MedPE-SWsnd-G2]|nr:MAG: hypothetical protein BM564_09560 [Bacteroidetes bacterium MedPE-SWsnd-G2]